MKRIAPMAVSIAVLILAVRTAAPAQDEKPKQETQDTKRLRAIGGLSASTLYFAFLSVGLTGDAFVKGAYEAEQVRSIMGELQAMLKSSAGQVKDLIKGEPDESDQAALKEIVEIADLVQEYAKFLAEYSKEKDAKIGDKYEASRKATWERLKKFLGIK